MDAFLDFAVVALVFVIGFLLATQLVFILERRFGLVLGAMAVLTAIAVFALIRIVGLNVNAAFVAIALYALMILSAAFRRGLRFRRHPDLQTFDDWQDDDHLAEPFAGRPRAT